MRILGLGLAALVLTACGSAPTPAHTDLDAAEVVRELSAHGVEANVGTVYQESEGVSGASFQADAIAINGPGGGPNDLTTGGLVQVFPDEAAAARGDVPSDVPVHTYRVGNAVIHVYKGLPEKDALRYRAALEEVVGGA
ncbi:hypothetical protein [Herbidospora cretacea]|uniref:hypothetical protein n=1 Tax=Herbidospora cretacea TaxID=28444 RepID=UPI0007735E71|nr:hypothetical protein [Herbidospora cretacea]